MRKGFSLITAIMFIVLVATLGALALSLSTFATKQTSDLYLRTQAELLAKSATEYALLAISGHDNSVDCVEQINSQYPEAGANALFDINVSLRYIGDGLPCNAAVLLDNNITTADSNLTVLIDTVITSANGVSTEPIRFHRRTLQKP